MFCHQLYLYSMSIEHLWLEPVDHYLTWEGGPWEIGPWVEVLLNQCKNCVFSIANVPLLFQFPSWVWPQHILAVYLPLVRLDSWPTHLRPLRAPTSLASQHLAHCLLSTDCFPAPRQVWWLCTDNVHSVTDTLLFAHFLACRVDSLVFWKEHKYSVFKNNHSEYLVTPEISALVLTFFVHVSLGLTHSVYWKVFCIIICVDGGVLLSSVGTLMLQSPPNLFSAWVLFPWFTDMTEW